MRAPSAQAVTDALTLLQREAAARAQWRWDEEELAEIVAADATAYPLRDIVSVVLTDLADDFRAGRRVTPPFRGTYAQYLRSDHWRMLRQRMLARSGGICQRCQRSHRDYGFLDVHHRDYRRFGAEREADLIVLCRECHISEHGGIRR